jgi:hypothetical protein
MPNPNTPPKLVEAWLEFHREGLCRNLDVVFAFSGQGMEIWCRSEENRSYRKLQQLIEPLRNSHDVDLYTTTPPKAKGAQDAGNAESDLPPSLLENRELHAYLRPIPGLNMPTPRLIQIVTNDKGESQVQVITPGFPGGPPLTAGAAEQILRSRLIAYARSVMEDSRIMRQYADDLCELVRVALEPAFAATLRRRAAQICRAHAKDLAKSVADLRKDLSYALPKTKEKTKEKKAVEKKTKESGKAGTPTPHAFIEKTESTAATARDLASQIYRFIYPQEHTVSLDDLRRPDLAASLEAFEEETRTLEREIVNLPAP